MLPGRVGNRKHQNGIPSRNRGPDNLYLLLHGRNNDAKVRHRHLLDFRACLFALRPAAELVLPEKRPLEKQESISRPAKISDQSGLKGEGISIMTFPADYQERGLFLS